jgi:hypothetical protein
MRKVIARSGYLRRRCKTIELPLLSPYVFLLSEDMGRTRGLIRERFSSVQLVSAGAGRGALVIPDNDINRLMADEAAGKFVYERFRAQPVEYRVGDMVLVVGGPLVDRSGMIQQRLNGHLYKVGVGNLTVTAKAEHLSPDDRQSRVRTGGCLR